MIIRHFHDHLIAATTNSGQSTQRNPYIKPRLKKSRQSDSKSQLGPSVILHFGESQGEPMDVYDMFGRVRWV